MDIIKMDTSELERYFAGNSFNEEENVADLAVVLEALEAFERGITTDTTLKDVKLLYETHWDKIASPHPTDGFREWFLMKILFYAVSLTNRDLPRDADESDIFKARRNDPGEDGVWVEGVRIALRNAFIFFDHWDIQPGPGTAFRKIRDHYSSTVTAMCKEAHVPVISSAEWEQIRQNSEVSKKERTKKWIIAGVIFVIGFHLVRFILSLFVN